MLNAYHANSQTKFKTTMSSLYDFSDAYIPVSGRIKITTEGEDADEQGAEQKVSRQKK